MSTPMEIDLFNLSSVRNTKEEEAFKRRYAPEAAALAELEAHLEMMIRNMPKKLLNDDDVPILSPDVALQQPEPVIQPKLEPSPSLRKSLVPEDIDNKMYPLGESKTYIPKNWKQNFRDQQEKSVYGGNPFSSILKSRGGSSNSYQKNVLSDFEDLPIRSIKKKNDFVQVSTYCEELVILLTKEDPTKSLTAPGQPHHFRVPLNAFRRSGNILAEFLVEKDKKVSEFTDGTVVYSFDKEPKPNIHIQEYAIYIDKLMSSEVMAAATRYLVAVPRFLIVEKMSIDQFWVGVVLWGNWASGKPFELPCHEDDIESAARVSIFLNDPAYANYFYEQVEVRSVDRSPISAGIMKPEITVFLLVVANRVV
ncbi:uncharacterized protein RCO7_09607 [Rhynchosporium graminicola]|uniref:Uncharacterized protein n=1 Tax=Rhynchosporium graminicola TaxID=2792576 RepID=A0A1E1LC76_9HELO|nr:uncharacterized protein RCO7_09607 [Rhynchosporium commune]